MSIAVNVIYCGVCNLPVEYCEFGNSIESCKKWLDENHPELFIEMKLSLSENNENKDIKEKENNIQKTEKSKKVSFSSQKQQPIQVIISQSSHNVRKFSTSIIGLHHFTTDLKKTSKALGKSFACGCSIVKNSDPPEINIQGDVRIDLPQYLIEHYKIPKNILYSSTKKGKKTRIYPDESDSCDETVEENIEEEEDIESIISSI